jgi:hypothetical protein
MVKPGATIGLCEALGERLKPVAREHPFTTMPISGQKGRFTGDSGPKMPLWWINAW